MQFEYREIWSDGKRQWNTRHTFECDTKTHPTYRFVKTAAKSKRRFKGLQEVTGNAEYFISHFREIKNTSEAA